MSETSKWGGLEFPRSNNNSNGITPILGSEMNINYIYGLTFRNIIVLRNSDTNKPIAIYVSTPSEAIHIQLEEIVSIETFSTTLVIKTEDSWTTYLIAVSEVEMVKIEKIFLDSLNAM